VRGSPVVSRTLTIIAVAFLTFDGAALAGLGFLSGRMVLLPVGVAFFVAAAAILWYWRSHRRRLQEIAAERGAVAAEARELQRLLGKK
jgi:uncharacterized iron-regulated membrane protein